MKKLIMTFTLFSSFTSFAATINHRNCELFLNSKSSQDFFRVVNLNSNDFAYMMKSKGYQAISYTSQPTLDRQVPMSGDQAEDLLSGELTFEVINPKALKTRILLLNMKKNEDGLIINQEFIRTETIVNYKRIIQTHAKFVKDAGLELVKQIPYCVAVPAN